MHITPGYTARCFAAATANARLATAVILAVALFSSGCIAREQPEGKPATGTESERTADEETGGCASRFLKSALPLTLKAGKIRPGERVRIPEPAKGESYLDPVYGVCIVRLTDHGKEPPEGFARNYYSRIQPFNANGTRVLVFDESGYWHLYDAKTFRHVKRLDLGGGSVEPHWHPSGPNLLYLLPNGGGLSMDILDVETGERTQVADFTELQSIAGYPDANDIRDVWPRAARIWTRWEGSPSRDGRYWAFQVETGDGEPLGLISFDLAASRITGTFDIRDVGRPDHVSMSPNGNHVVASWPEDAADCPWLRDTGTRDKPCGLMAFSPDFESATALASRSPHSDMAIDADGREVIVISNYVSGNLEMIDLATGEATRLWRIYIDGASTSLHISGKAYRTPGWVLVSTYWTKDPDDADPWYENKLMAVELKEDPRILNIANIVSKTRSYFSEPHASVNRDFTRIVFNANWGTGKDKDIDVYMAMLPEDAIPPAR